MSTTDNTYLEQHVRAFNAAVDKGDWGPFVERFTDDAVLELVGPPVGRPTRCASTVTAIASPASS